MGRVYHLSGRLDIPLVNFRRRSGIHTRHKSKHSIQRNRRRTTVADQRQRQADNRRYANAHADVDAHLENKRRSSAKADHSTHIRLGTDAHIDASNNNGQQQYNHQQAAHKTHFLTDSRENEVRVLSVQRVGLGTVTIKQTLAGEAAAVQGQQTLVGMPTNFRPRRTASSTLSRNLVAVRLAGQTGLTYRLNYGTYPMYSKMCFREHS